MKKGFTLVELVIVLVIIGIIIGTSIKGKALIDVTRAKSDLAQLTQLQVAVGSYQAKKGVLPYTTQQLIDAGLINQNDLNLRISRGTSGIIDCELKVFSGNKFIWYNNNFKSVCYIVDKEVGSDFESYAESFLAFSPKHACPVETTFDDTSMNTGDGVGDMYIDRWTPFESQHFDDCYTLSTESANYVPTRSGRQAAVDVSDYGYLLY